MTAVHEAARAYRQQAVLTASKEKLVVLLYDACLGELEKAHVGILEQGNPARVGESLGKAFSIVSELKTALNIEAGGEIAENLDSLYAWVQERITTANGKREAAPAMHAIQVMRELKEGWDGILRSA